MRVMVQMRATKDSESGVMPEEKDLAAMGDYNEELTKAGIMVDGEGIHSSAEGARVKFSGAGNVVEKGPFPTEEVIAGYWLWQVKSMDEALEWAKRCPNPSGEEFTIEIRPIFEVEDFGDTATPEIREQEARIRQQVSEQKPDK